MFKVITPLNKLAVAEVISGRFISSGIILLISIGTLIVQKKKENV